MTIQTMIMMMIVMTMVMTDDDFDDNDDKNNMNMSILTMMITDSVILDDCRKVSQRVSFPSSPDTWNADN